eukprot:scaffold1170_cov174-Amphora_coffeaeformis.AAC.46
MKRLNMMQREQREPPSTSVVHCHEEGNQMSEATSTNNEIVLTPTRQGQFWRRFFRQSPGSSVSSSQSRGSSSQSRRFRRKGRDGDEEKSHYSSSSSSQSGSDDSEHSRKQNREQRLAKYLSVDTACRPISLIANEGDLMFHRSSSDAREDNNDEDDIDEDSSADECRDDVCLLRDKLVFQSHLLHTPTSLKETTEEEDRVSLLSEHDDLLENRRGSYNVDCVDPLTINEPAALQKMPLLSLRQELAAQEENIHSQWNYLLPHQKQQQQAPNKVLVDTDLNESIQKESTPNQEALVPLQIDFPSGKTTEGVIYPATSQSPVQKRQTKTRQSKNKPAEKQPDEHAASALNPLGEETPAFSEIISDRTQKHKAFYLSRLRSSQKKKNNAVTRPPSVHGDLWTLPELPSDDECSRFSQVSENISRRLKSGSWLSEAKNNQIIREDQLALISALQ